MRKQNLPIKRLATEEALQQVADDLKYPNLESLYVAVGEGHVSPQSVVARLSRLVSGTTDEDVTEVPLARPVKIGTQDISQGVVVKGLPDVWVRLGRCCTPVPGDEIIGFVTRGQGVSVHRTDCPNVKSLRREPERLIDVTWSEGKPTSFIGRDQVEALDRTRLLSDVATVLSDSPREHPLGDLGHREGPHHPAAIHVRARRHRAPVQRARGRQARGDGLRRVPRGPQLTMRVVLQRVARASVTVEGGRVAAIGPGYLLLVGIGADDADGEAEPMAEKVANLRLFADAEGKTNLALADVDGEALVVSQFTLYADTRKGRRPSWTDAAEPAVAAERVEAFASALEARGVRVGRGVFGAHMEVELVNDGPFTLVLDTGT